MQVWDNDFGVADDDYLGSAVLDLAAVCDGQQHELDLELRGSPFATGADNSAEGAAGGGGSGGGRVQLSCRFEPFSQLLAGEGGPAVGGVPLLAAPGEIPLAADWQRLLELAGVATHAMFQPVAFLESPSTNTQAGGRGRPWCGAWGTGWIAACGMSCLARPAAAAPARTTTRAVLPALPPPRRQAWLYCNWAQRSACLAFRGTEQDKWRDLITDLHLVRRPLLLVVSALPGHARPACCG